MKTPNFHVLSCCAVLAMALSVGHAAAQLTPSLKSSQAAANRKAYLSGTLKLNYNEIGLYEQALETRANNIRLFDKTDLSHKERQVKVKEIDLQFKNSVKQIFSPAQYGKWISDNHGSGTIRNLIEDFGLTKEQVALYSELCKEYRSNYNKTLNALIPKREKEELISRYTGSFRTKLAASIGSERAKPISDAFFINYSAYRLGQYYTFMSADVTLEYAKERYAMQNKLDELKKRGNDKKTYLAEKERINDEYEARLRAIIPAADYAKKVKIDDAYYDKHFIKTFGATPQQLQQYKNLMNEIAISKLRVRETRSSKAVKSQRLQEINTTMETKLAQILSAEQMAKWKKIRGM